LTSELALYHEEHRAWWKYDGVGVSSISSRRLIPLRAVLLIGGYGFLSMFYWGGAHSVPRRYAIYPLEVAQGTLYAKIAVGFISVLLLGILLYLWETGKRCLKALSA
jgi:heme/copper-type cytochrome/quinol oxidase subunit 1